MMNPYAVYKTKVLTLYMNPIPFALTPNFSIDFYIVTKCQAWCISLITHAQGRAIKVCLCNILWL